MRRLPKRDVVIIAEIQSQNASLRVVQISPSFFDWTTQALHMHSPPTPSLDSPTAEIKNLEIDSFIYHVNHMPTWQGRIEHTMIRCYPLQLGGEGEIACKSCRAMENS
jgi:hypothetical protein